MSADPYRYFRVEAAELLDQLNRAVLDFERGAGPEVVVPLLMRHAHTLKGAARIVRQGAIADVAHAIEDLLEPHRRATVWTNAEGLAEGLTALLQKIASILTTLSPAPSGSGRDQPRVDKVEADGRETESTTTIRADAEKVEGLVTALTQVIAEHHAFEAVANQAVDDACLSVERLVEWTAEGRSLSLAEARGSADVEALAAALTRLQSAIRGSAGRVARELEATLGQARELRLQPADTIFAGLERALRDAARNSGKRVALESSGGAEKVDAWVLERVRGVLVQVVGNAVVHGIETPEERRVAGKQETATVRLEVERGRDTVTFRCRDDGRGANIGAIRRSLGERGLPVPDDEAALLEGLLQDGVTTSPSVSGLAGRGVGLAGAQAVAADLGGRLALRSEAGRGFVVELVIPSALRVIECIDVDAGEVTASIPTGSISRCELLTDAQLAAISTAGGLPEGRGLVPIVLLEEVVGVPVQQGPRRGAVVLRTARGMVALLAQRIGKRRSGVLHRIPSAARVPARFLGVILGATGRPRIVLDPDGVIASGHPFEVVTSPRLAPRILVIDDSLTTRMLEQSILEAHGYQVELAESAEEGIRKAETARYDLYLVDVEMPGADGFWFVAQTRANSTTRNTPAVLVSSRSSEEDLARGVSVGAAGYIVKGRFDQSEFLALVNRLTEVHT